MNSPSTARRLPVVPGQVRSGQVVPGHVGSGHVAPGHVVPGQVARPPRPRPAVVVSARTTGVRPSLPAGAQLGDRRGLTAVGAVAVALLFGALGGGYDVATGPGLRAAFAVCFVLGCALAAAAVHRERLGAAVVMPPLVYALLALLAGAAERTDTAGSFLTQQALDLLNALVLGAPVLLTATAAALVVAGARLVAGAASGRPTSSS